MHSQSWQASSLHHHLPTGWPLQDVCMTTVEFFWSEYQKLMFSCSNLSNAFISSSPSCSISSCFFHIDKTPTTSANVSAVNCLDPNFGALLVSITSPLLLIQNALQLKIECCCEVASWSADLAGGIKMISSNRAGYHGVMIFVIRIMLTVAH